MFISEDEVKKRLNSPKNLINSLGIGKEVNVKEIPKRIQEAKLSPELRVVAGVVGNLMGPKEAANALGIKERQVKSAVNTTDTNIRTLIDQKILDIEKLALDRTIQALGLLTPDMISGEKPKDIAIIAGQMSKVISNIKGNNRAGNDNRTQFIVYAPSMKNERDYTVIESSVA